MQEYNEKEKILIIFTICFLHFYTNFTYENTFSFEDYFNQNLINLCTKYNVFVIDIKQFKIFCYSFYYQLIKEIKNVNYAHFKNMYAYYNPSALEEEKIILGENFISNNNFKNYFRNEPIKDVTGGPNTNKFLWYFKNYVNTSYTSEKYQNLKTNLQKIVNKKIMTPLISTTERVVDMVLSVIK